MEANNANKTAIPDLSQKGTSKKVVISVMGLAIMNVTTIVSLRGLPSQAEYGLSSIFYYSLAALLMLIPVSLVCAELASTFPKKGGLFRWVSEGLGVRWGFVAMYMEWLAIVMWFPTVLIFAGVAIAYICWPESFDATLASNKTYTIITLLAVYWLATLNTFRGLKASAKLSTYGGLFGTIIPAAILVILAAIYLIMGQPVHLPLDQPFFPDFSKLNTLVLAASIFLFYAGMEMQAVHVEHLKNPKKNYPIAVFIATLITICIFILCTLSVGVVIPEKEINLVQTLLIAYEKLWSNIGLPWMGHVMAFMCAFGVLGQSSVMIGGTTTGMLMTGRAGYLPKPLQRTNKNGMQVPILLIQGVIISCIVFVLILLPSVQSGYQVFSQMATIIFLIMYVIIYIAAIRLRYTQPNKKRAFLIPGGKFGIWFVGLFGLFGAISGIVLSFIPPSQINIGSPAVYVSILIVGVLFFSIIPFVIYALRKPNWFDTNSQFEPFDFELEGRKASEKSKWPADFEPTPQQIEEFKQKRNNLILEWENTHKKK